MIRLLIMAGLVLELASRIHLDWKRRVARDLAPYGVAPKQMFVLRKVAESGTLAPSELAELLHADRPSVTSMLDTLERARWVSRQRDPGNGKRVLVALTAEGREKLASVPERLWRSGKTAVDPEACLSAAERSELVALLRRVHRVITDTAPGEPS